MEIKKVLLSENLSGSYRGSVHTDGGSYKVFAKGVVKCEDGSPVPAEVADECLRAYGMARSEELRGVYTAAGWAGYGQLTASKDFDGATFAPKLDAERLRGQLERVYGVLASGGRHTLKSLSERTKSPEASVSARLRDLRKRKFGALVVRSERVAGGVWEYWLGEI